MNFQKTQNRKLIEFQAIFDKNAINSNQTTDAQMLNDFLSFNRKLREEKQKRLEQSLKIETNKKLAQKNIVTINASRCYSYQEVYGIGQKKRLYQNRNKEQKSKNEKQCRIYKPQVVDYLFESKNKSISKKQEKPKYIQLLMIQKKKVQKISCQNKQKFQKQTKKIQKQILRPSYKTISDNNNNSYNSQKSCQTQSKSEINLQDKSKKMKLQEKVQQKQYKDRMNNSNQSNKINRQKQIDTKKNQDKHRKYDQNNLKTSKIKQNMSEKSILNKYKYHKSQIPQQNRQIKDKNIKKQNIKYRKAQFSSNSSSSQSSDQSQPKWRKLLRQTTHYNPSDKKFKQLDKGQIQESSAHQLFRQEYISRKQAIIDQQEDLRLQKMYNKKKTSKNDAIRKVNQTQKLGRTYEKINYKDQKQRQKKDFVQRRKQHNQIQINKKKKQERLVQKLRQQQNNKKKFLYEANNRKQQFQNKGQKNNEQKLKNKQQSLKYISGNKDSKTTSVKDKDLINKQKIHKNLNRLKKDQVLKNIICSKIKSVIKKQRQFGQQYPEGQQSFQLILVKPDSRYVNPEPAQFNFAVKEQALVSQRNTEFTNLKPAQFDSVKEQTLLSQKNYGIQHSQLAQSNFPIKEQALLDIPVKVQSMLASQIYKTNNLSVTKQTPVSIINCNSQQNITTGNAKQQQEDSFYNEGNTYIKAQQSQYQIKHQTQDFNIKSQYKNENYLLKELQQDLQNFNQINCSFQRQTENDKSIKNKFIQNLKQKEFVQNPLQEGEVPEEQINCHQNKKIFIKVNTDQKCIKQQFTNIKQQKQFYQFQQFEY